jgi:hypothetical protein
VVWETIFMLLVLKIPLVYLCAVVWWAIRAEPLPEEPAALVGAGLPVEPTPPRSWRYRTRVPGRPLGGGPVRRPSGGRHAAARAEARR